VSGPSGEACGRCYYCVDPAASDEYTGICRRYPKPSSEPHQGDYKVWVSLGSWCGEFKLHPKMQGHLWAAMRGEGGLKDWEDEPARKPA
jgi:hypothetical protein